MRCRALRLELEDGHDQYHRQVGEFLERIGRRKFVVSIFRAPMKTATGASYARERFQRIGSRLHFIARTTVQKILDR